MLRPATGREAQAVPEISKTADQALLVLLELADAGPSTAGELARRLRLNRTVVHRLLATLIRRSFAHRDPAGRYQLGVALLHLATHVEGRLREISRPVLEELAGRFSESAVLAVPDGDDATPVEQARGARNIMHVDYHSGMRHPLWQGAHGRAILARAADGTVARALAASPDCVRYRRLLDEVRQRGYATSHDELQAGVTGLAAPVVGAGQRVIGSVGVVAPTARFPPEAELAAAVRRAAECISAQLGPDTAVRTASGRRVAAVPAGAACSPAGAGIVEGVRAYAGLAGDGRAAGA